MTHRLTTNYAKKYCNRTLIVKVIVENVVTCFLGHGVVGNYSVSQKIPPCGFLNFFPNGWEFLINFLHTYYTIISTLENKVLFKYVQL